MAKSNFVYTGCENLEAMKEAQNYNTYLIDLVANKGKLQKNNTKKILDFGAGSGTYADMLTGLGYRIDCVEPDKTLQHTLKAKNYKVYNDVSDLKPNSYDVIYSLNVFEHIVDHNKVIAKLHKALKKDGILIIYVPAFPFLYSSMDKRVEHVRRYKRNSLRDLAENNSFKVEHLEYRDPIGFGAALTYKYVGNDNGIISPSSVRIYDRYIFPLSKLVEPIFKYSIGKNVVLIASKT